MQSVIESSPYDTGMDNYEGGLVTGTVVGVIALLSLLTGALCLHRFRRRSITKTQASERALEHGHIQSLPAEDNLYGSVHRKAEDNNISPVITDVAGEPINNHMSSTTRDDQTVSPSSSDLGVVGVTHSSEYGERRVPVTAPFGVQCDTGEMGLDNDLSSSTVEGDKHEISHTDEGNCEVTRSSIIEKSENPMSSTLEGSQLKGDCENNHVSEMKFTETSENFSSSDDLYQSIDMSGSDKEESANSSHGAGKVPPSLRGLDTSSKLSNTSTQPDRLDVVDVEEDYYESVDTEGDVKGNNSKSRLSFPKYSVVRKNRKHTTDDELKQDTRSGVDDYYSNVDIRGEAEDNTAGSNNNNASGGPNSDGGFIRDPTFNGKIRLSQRQSQCDEYYASVDMPTIGQFVTEQQTDNAGQSYSDARSSQSVDGVATHGVDDYYQSVDSTDMKTKTLNVNDLSTQDLTNRNSFEDGYYQSVDICEVNNEIANKVKPPVPSIVAAEKTTTDRKVQSSFTEEPEREGPDSRQDNAQSFNNVEEDYESIDMADEAHLSLKSTSAQRRSEIESLYSEVKTSGSVTNESTSAFQGTSLGSEMYQSEDNETRANFNPIRLYTVVNKKRKSGGTIDKSAETGREKEEINSDKLHMNEKIEANANVVNRNSLQTTDNNTDITQSDSLSRSSSTNELYQDIGLKEATQNTAYSDALSLRQCKNNDRSSDCQSVNKTENKPEESGQSGDNHQQDVERLSSVTTDSREVNRTSATTINNEHPSDQTPQCPDNEDYDHLDRRTLGGVEKRMPGRTSAAEEDDYSHI